jgi:uncharacterized protein YbaP (TraB family)
MLTRLAALICLGLAWALGTTAWSRAEAQEERSKQNPAGAAGQHALWSVRGKTNTVYLLGSVHFLSPSEQLPDAMDVAYQDAEALLMEIDMDDLDPLQAQRVTLELGTLPAGQSLEQEIGPQAYAKLSEQSRELGLDPALLNQFRPWLAALTLVQLHLVKMGLDPNAGVERRLSARAVQDGKEIRGLETLEQQLGMLANMPQKQQREFLMYSLEDTERATQEIDSMIAAWRRGDAASLAKLLADGFDKYPEIYRPLTVNRNQQWVPQLEGLLDDKEDYLVVVGALHLVGKDSVIELLERKGHRVKQH